MPRAFSDHERAHIRAQILNSARAALPRTGFRRTSVDQLARAVGISKGAFYAFFPSKTDVWITLLQEAEQQLRGALDAIITAPPPTKGRLYACLHLIFTSVHDHPLLSALSDPADLAWLRRSLPPGAMDDAQADDDRWFSRLLARLVAKGDAHPNTDAAVFSRLPAAALALATQRGLMGEDHADSVVELIVGGLVSQMRS